MQEIAVRRLRLNFLNSTDVSSSFHVVSSKDRPYGLKLFDLLPGTSKTRFHGSYATRDQVIGFIFLLNSFVGVHETVFYKPLDLALFGEFRELESPAKERWVANKIKEWKLNYAVQSRLFSERTTTHLLCFHSMRVVVAPGLVNYSLAMQLKG